MLCAKFEIHPVVLEKIFESPHRFLLLKGPMCNKHFICLKCTCNRISTDLILHIKLISYFVFPVFYYESIAVFAVFNLLHAQSPPCGK